MNDNELRQLWQASNEKLEQNKVLYRSASGEIANLKAFYLVASMKPLKIFALITGLIWVFMGAGLLGNLYLNQYWQVNKFFLFSATFQVGITAIAVIIYLYQLVSIYQFDVTEPVIKTQERLCQLKTSTLLVTRILILQLPVWTTFYLSADMLQNGNWFLWTIQGLVTLFFTLVAIWLFREIRYENRDKYWFRLIFKGKEWTPLMQSMELLGLIEEYKQDFNPSLGEQANLAR